MANVAIQAERLMALLRSRWAHVVGKTVGVTASASFISLLTSTIIFRTLPLEDAGRLALLTTLVETIILVGGLGQSSLLVGLYSQKPLGHYDWQHDLRQATLVTLPSLFVICLVTSYLYGFDAQSSLFLLLAALIAALILGVAQILNSQRQYQWGNVLFRLHNNIMLLPALLLLIFMPLRHLNFVLASQSAAYVLTAALGIRLLQRAVPRGNHQLRPYQLGQGLTFVASGSSAVVADTLLLAFAGLMVASPELAAFAALNALFRPVQLLQNVFSKVLVTEFARETETNYKQTILRMGVASVAAVAVATALLPFAAHWLYAGRYDWAIFLIVWIGAANALDLAEVIPRSYIFGCAPTRLLNWFIAMQVLIAALGIGGGWLLIRQYGILGVAMGGAAIYAMRLVISYGFFLKSVETKSVEAK